MNMILRLFFLFLLCVPAFAQAASHQQIRSALAAKEWDTAYGMARNRQDEFIGKLAQWYYLRNNDVIAPAATYQRFLQQNKNWPDEATLRKRMEIAFLSTNPSNDAVIQWFHKHRPLSPRAQLIYGVARDKVDDTALHTLWIEGDFSKDEQARILQAMGKRLHSRTHAARIDRLLWDGHTSAAERLLSYVSAGDAKLAKARIGLRLRRSNVDGLVAAVPRNLQSHAGLIYERMRFRARRRDYAGAAEMLKIAPRNLPRAHLWWKTQKRIIRDAIEDGHYRLAKTLLDKHSQITALPRVEAEWLRGWLYHAFLKQPKIALTAFANIYQTAKYPISRSRGAYWAARAAEDAGDKSLAQSWYRKAAVSPTTFYGQLAHQTLKPNTPLPLPALAQTSASDIERFAANDPLARQFVEFARNDQASLLWPFIKHEFKRNGSPSFLAKLGGLATKMGAHTTGINIAKEALNKGLYLPQLFPVLETPSPLAIDPAFALAITRQESRFDIKARSSANARGLMQLLPTTAKRTAQQHNISYSLSKLYQPRTNMLLGSHFMNGLLKRFDNAYILSIAGYNAGPGRSNQWEKRFGSITQNPKRNIQWMEMIPFSETRNYVQRVLENYHVYRHLLSGGKEVLRAQERLVR